MNRFRIKTPKIVWVGIFAACLAIQSNTQVSAQSGSRSYSNRSATQSSTRQPTAQQPAGFALVELFTSEGCSSCPSADANLIRMVNEARQKNLPIYALSFHVDYWNKLGWTDPYSSKEFTQRQQEYARAMKSDRVYTPQMIVNGKVQFVGSNKNTSNTAINSAMRTRPTVGVMANVRQVAGRSVTVDVKLSGRVPVEHINVALVQKSGQQKADAGENRNRTLQHVNIVRDFATTQSRSGQVKLNIPQGMNQNDFQVIAYAQDRNRQVLGVTATALASR